MNAPLRNRVECILLGHDWRQAIDPREGYYERCRRCWKAREAKAPGEPRQTARAN